MSTTKIIIYTPRQIPVEVIESFQVNDQILVVIKAISGQPFADGAKTTTKTAYRTVKRSELEECTCTPRDEMACRVCRQAIREKYGDDIPF